MQAAFEKLLAGFEEQLGKHEGPFLLGWVHAPVNPSHDHNLHRHALNVFMGLVALRGEREPCMHGPRS